MDSLRAQSLLPFVPSAQFILQKFENQAFAENFMVRLNVADLDEWWQVVSKKQLEKTYPQFRMKPPKDFPWGREVNFIDLAGVCWHVGQEA